MRDARQRLSTIWLAVSIAVLALGASPADLAAAPLRIGVIPLADVLPLYAAIDQGFLAAEKVEIELVNLSSGTRIVEGLAGGSLEIGLSATLSLLQAAQQGLELVIIEPAAFMRRDQHAVNGLMIPRGSAVKTAADLRGKTIGVNAINNINYLMTVELLARHGVGPKQVTWQEIPFPQMGPALENRSADAVSIVEPFLTVLRDSDKGVLLSPGQEVAAGVSLSAYAALRPWYEKNRQGVEAFDRAYKRGVEWVTREPVRSRELLAKYTKTPPELAARISLHEYRLTIDPNELTLLADLARRHGLLREPPAADRLLAPTARGR